MSIKRLCLYCRAGLEKYCGTLCESCDGIYYENRNRYNKVLYLCKRCSLHDELGYSYMEGGRWLCYSCLEDE